LTLERGEAAEDVLLGISEAKERTFEVEVEFQRHPIILRPFPSVIVNHQSVSSFSSAFLLQQKAVHSLSGSGFCGSSSSPASSSSSFPGGVLVAISTYIPEGEKSQPSDVPHDDEGFVAALKYLLNNQPRVPNREEHKDLRKYKFDNVGTNSRGHHECFDIDLSRI